MDVLSWTMITLLLTQIAVSRTILDVLIQEVMQKYESAVRPECGAQSPTTVTIDIALRQIVELDEPRQFLSTIVWVRLAWNDCRLQWNTSHYDGIDYVVLPNSMVWVPDVTLYDNTENKLSGISDKYNLMVRSNGNVQFNFPSVIRSICAVDVNNFPFDHQACRLKFGSWSYPGSNLDIQNASHAVDLSSFIMNTEWTVHSASVYRVATTYGSDEYATVDCIIRLKRRPLFYLMNLICPCCLISLVAIMGFMLPPAAGEKVNLEVTVLLSLSVFQLIVLDLMPPSSDSVSFIGLYFLVSMSLVGMSCLATVIVLNVHFHGQLGGPLPPWAFRFISGPMAGLLCMDNSFLHTQRHDAMVPNNMRRYEVARRPHATIEHGIYALHEEPQISLIAGKTSGNNACISDSQNDQASSHAKIHDQTHAQNCSHNTIIDVRVIPLLEQVRDSVNKIEEELKKHGTRESISEWYIFARMLDRMFMILYIVFLGITVIVLSVNFIGMVKTPPLWNNFT